jgi:hypothetical protein
MLNSRKVNPRIPTEFSVKRPVLDSTGMAIIMAACRCLNLGNWNISTRGLGDLEAVLVLQPPSRPSRRMVRAFGYSD